MSRSRTVVLLWLGGLGRAEFGRAWHEVGWHDIGPLSDVTGHWLGRVIGRRRIDRWVTATPSATVISLVLVNAGAIMFATVAS